MSISDANPISNAPVPQVTISSDTSNNQKMTNWQRARWGALGSVLPFLIRLSGEHHVYESVQSLGWTGAIDLVFPATISILAAAFVALIFKDEANIYKLVILGISAPALITSWQGYNLAQEQAKNLSRDRQIQNDSASPDSSRPRGSASLDVPTFSFEAKVNAADLSELKTFSHYEPSVAERILASLKGGAPIDRDYFVIVEASASKEEAEKQKNLAIKKLPSADIELFQSPPEYSPIIYSVVIAPNRSFDEATALLKTTTSAGFNPSYIWTFGYPLHPTSNVDNQSKAIVSLTSIDTKHDGGPGSRKWKFDILLNKTKVGGIPEQEFKKDRPWLTPTVENLAYQWRATVPAGGEIDFRIKGYRPSSIIPADGSAEINLGDGISRNVVVEVKNKIPSLGWFLFHFTVQKSSD